MEADIAATRRLATRNNWIVASPIAVFILGALAARVSILLLGQWAWTATGLVYWGSMALVVAAFAGRTGLARWFRPSRGSRWWPVTAVVVGLCAFPLLLVPNLGLLRTPAMVLLWMCYALVNGTIEEIYWRGFLLDEIKGWPRWGTIAYSSVFFVAIHFVMLGAFARALFNIPFLIILIFLTLFYVVLYLGTRSLRWPVVSHALTDLGNMNIFVFMNLIQLP